MIVSANLYMPLATMTFVLYFAASISLRKGDELQCAATNGSMLVRNIYKVEDDGQEYNFLLHSRAAKIVRSMTSKSDEKVQVFITDREMAFQTETDYFRTRLIEGRYPNYNAVIPTDSDKNAILDKNELLGGRQTGKRICGQGTLRGGHELFGIVVGAFGKGY